MALCSRWVPKVKHRSVDLRGRALILGDRFVAGFGAAYGTAKAGVGIASMGVLRPELVMKSIVPIVMAGVLGIYGLIISVIISTGSESPLYQPQPPPPPPLVSSPRVM